MLDWHELQFKWLGCQLILIAIWFPVCLSIASSDSSDLDVEWFEIQVVWLSSDLRFQWFGCQLIWNSNDLVVNWSEIKVAGLSTEVKWLEIHWFWFGFHNSFEIQVMRLSTDRKFNWLGCRVIWIFRVGCHWIWEWNDLVVEWFELQMIWLSIDYLKVKWYSCRLVWTSSVLVGYWFESQMMRLSSDLKFKFKCFVPIPKSQKPKRQSVFGQKRHLWFCQPMRRHRNPKKQALDSYTTTLMFRDNSKPTKKNTAKAFFLLDEAQTEWGLHASGHVRSVQTHTSLPMRRQ